MKKILIYSLYILLFTCSSAGLNAQSTESPIDYLKGTWLRKVTKVTADGDDGSWKDVNAVVQFKETLNGKGLRQISSENGNESEVNYFYDEPNKKLYGMSIDANGYVWQSEMGVNDDGSFQQVTGVALNDKSGKETIDLEQVSYNEMSFVYKVYKNKKVIVTAEGVFLRIPKY